MVTTGFFSCGQPGKTTPENFETETVNSVRKYEYADSMGKRLIIENSFSRGIKYTEPNGKEYSKIMFWTRIINETEKVLELKIDLPVYSYEVPTLPGKYFKILIPSDTMTPDKEALQDYGMKDLKSFLDTSIYKPSYLKRTINPNESGGFYVVLLFDNGVSGPTRTGLSIKGQNLFYKVTRYTGKQGVSFVDEKEINCGSINLKNLVRQK
jgi:hypothetical protein